MTSLRLTLALTIVGLVAVLGLWIGGVIGPNEANSALGRTILLVLLLGAGTSLVLALMGKRKDPEPPNRPNSGPQF